MKNCLKPRETGFSFVEVLLVIAVIGIIAALALPYVRGVNEQASALVARQQQAELQTALGNWISAKSSQPGGLAAARAAYDADKRVLLKDYLQESTLNNLIWNGATVTSGALRAAKATLRFSSWSTTNQPTVEWVNQ